jgi:hypothetical protein
LKKRTTVRCLDPEARECNFLEVSFGYNEEEAKTEADRCLKCGICSECYQCVDACLANAVNHDMQPKRTEVEVGSVILAPGFTPYDPSKHAYYAYANHPNVVTALEMERLLSASGPYQGHLVRPSDQKEPDKIAWLQCIGSRDINQCDHAYCSGVCCMYAAKQTVIAKEHSDKALDTAVFFMDMRTYGKDFERYYNRCKDEHGVRFVRSRVHTIDPAEDDSLSLRYVSEDGDIVEEVFDMVVLSVGLAPNEEAVRLAKTIGVELNHHKFAQTSDLAPVATNKEGIYVCGVFQGPKDIPQSVMEASAASSAAASNLASARGTLTRTKQLPPELDVSDQEPRVGVFVCNCGINIGGVADVPAVGNMPQSSPRGARGGQPVHLLPGHPGQNERGDPRTRHQPGGGGLLLTAHPRTAVPGDHPGCRPEQIPVRNGQYPRPEHLGAHEQSGQGHRESQGPGPHGRGQGRLHRTSAPGEPGGHPGGSDRGGRRRLWPDHGGGQLGPVVRRPGQGPYVEALIEKVNSTIRFGRS